MSGDMVMDGLVGVNNLIQGFVDLVPLGRTVVDGVHSAQHWNDTSTPDYNALTNKASITYASGQAAGLLWNVVTGRAAVLAMVKAAPALQASKFPQLQKLGELILNTRSITNIDKARNTMELARAMMYSFRFYKNWERLKQGKINRAQFDLMNSKDTLNYQLGASIWAIPGTYGLWIAAANLVVGTIANEQKIDSVLEGKK